MPQERRVRPLSRRRRIAQVGAVAAALLAAFVACVSTDFEDGRFACNPKIGAGAAAESQCPRGLVCASDGRCRVNDLRAVLDAARVEPDVVEAPEASIIPDAGGVSCPEARWTVATDARAPAAIASTDDGRVFAAGAAGAEAWLAEIDRCDGGIVREQTFTLAGANSVRFASLAIAGAEVVTAGASKTDAVSQPVRGRFDARLGKVALEPVNIGVSGEASHVVISKDGAEWMTGPSSGASPGFIAKVNAPTCTTTLPTKPGGLVVAADGSARVLRGGASAEIDRVDLTCVRTAAADPIGVPGATGAVTPVALSAIGNDLVAVGTAPGTNVNTFAWLARTNGGTKWTVAPFDPNPFDPDEARAVAYDGEALFVAVSQRVLGPIGTPTLLRFGATIAATSKPEWFAAPFGAILLDIRHVAIDPLTDQAVYVVASAGGSGAIARCTKRGACQ